MGKMQRNKGSRVEREMVELLRKHKIQSEKVPLSGAMQGFPGDINVYASDLHLVCEVKSRAKSLWKTLVNWLSGSDILILKANRQDPYVFMPMRVFIELVKSNQSLNVKQLEIVRDIFDYCEKNYKQSREDIISQKRSDDLNICRKIIIKLLNSENFTSHQIGNVLNRDHSAITKALGKMSNDQN